jgi:hypothetical protein
MVLLRHSDVLYDSLVASGCWRPCCQYTKWSAAAYSITTTDFRHYLGRGDICIPRQQSQPHTQFIQPTLSPLRNSLPCQLTMRAVCHKCSMHFLVSLAHNVCIMQPITGYNSNRRESDASHSLLLFETESKNTFITAV